MKKKIAGFIIFMMCAVCMGCSQKTAKAERETGSIFDMQKSQEIVIPHMTFCGWYTTPDYQPGTEVTGASGASDAWAKMALDMSVIK